MKLIVLQLKMLKLKLRRLILEVCSERCLQRIKWRWRFEVWKLLRKEIEERRDENLRIEVFDELFVVFWFEFS